MTDPRPISRAEQRRRTEARILEAAAEVFVADGYDRATIRAVAGAAGVDGGLVTYYFGSKQELFRRVIDAAPVPEVDAAAPGGALEQILATLSGQLENEPAASLAIMRSVLTNPEAAEAVRGGAARHEAQIAQAIVGYDGDRHGDGGGEDGGDGGAGSDNAGTAMAEDARLRAALISAVLLGVTVSRHLIKSGELAAADPERIISLLRPCLQSLTAAPGGREDDGENGRERYP